MAIYKTKSTEINAVKFTCENLKEVMDFIGSNRLTIGRSSDNVIFCIVKNENSSIRVSENKYIVKGSDEEFYMCSEDSFETVYEKVEE
jgi:hypothetical protein